MTTNSRRATVTHLQAQYPVSARRACRLVRLARSRWQHTPVPREDDALAQALRDGAAAKPRFGYRPLHRRLAREGWHVNHKHVRRVHRDERLQLRPKRRRRKRVAIPRVPRPVAAASTRTGASTSSATSWRADVAFAR